jgi:hypothetical protein
MDYQQLRTLFKNRNMVFNGYNSADGTTNDSTTDAVITRDPNNFLVPKINGMTAVNTITVVVGILAFIILLPLAIKQIKSII